MFNRIAPVACLCYLGYRDNKHGYQINFYSIYDDIIKKRYASKYDQIQRVLYDFYLMDDLILTNKPTDEIVIKSCNRRITDKEKKMITNQRKYLVKYYHDSTTFIFDECHIMFNEVFNPMLYGSIIMTLFPPLVDIGVCGIIMIGGIIFIFNTYNHCHKIIKARRSAHSHDIGKLYDAAMTKCSRFIFDKIEPMFKE